jgi:hypothetical protein
MGTFSLLVLIVVVSESVTCVISSGRLEKKIKCMAYLSIIHAQQNKRHVQEQQNFSSLIHY